MCWSESTTSSPEDQQRSGGEVLELGHEKADARTQEKNSHYTSCPPTWMLEKAMSRRTLFV